MKNLAIAVITITMSLTFFGAEQNSEEKKLQDFITKHVEKIQPLEKQLNLAHWEASNSGKTEDYDKLNKLELTIRQIYSDPEDFALLKELKQSGRVKDQILARQLVLLYNAYLKNQIAPDLLKEIVDLSTKIEKKFNTFRGTIDAEEVTINQINEILTTETDSAKRQKAWQASKQVGNVIVDDLIKLVKLRNKAAKKLGFNNYHTLALITTEQDVKQLDQIFIQLEKLTREPFAQMKIDLDRTLAEMYGITAEQLRPWHYHDPFFQRTPLVFEQDLDLYYKDKDVKELAQKFYASIDLPVDVILANSDLYDRKDKYPHAFSTDIDRQGDVRILCNLKNNEQWMETILHELGHAVYDKHRDPDNLPYLLRQPAQSFTTEAVAMFFGRLSRNAPWMHEMLQLSDQQRADIEKVSTKYTRLQQLIFARWAMVMYNFEKQLYANPDQDLNTLWWDMVERYQFVKRPDGPPDAGWASKLHFTGAPCYYHNYMLGELLASQLHHHIVYNILRLESDKDVGYVGCKKLGNFLRKKVFEAAALYHWNSMIELATGRSLTPEYFVKQFVE